MCACVCVCVSGHEHNHAYEIFMDVQGHGYAQGISGVMPPAPSASPGPSNSQAVQACTHLQGLLFQRLQCGWVRQLRFYGLHHVLAHAASKPIGPCNPNKGQEQQGEGTRESRIHGSGFVSCGTLLRAKAENPKSFSQSLTLTRAPRF